MRRLLLLLMTMALLIVGAVPALAGTTSLDGPDPAIWLMDPDGDGSITGGVAIDDASGSAKVNDNGATIEAKATGLEPGHTYTMWVVYFNDQTECGEDGCNGADLGDPDVGGGVLFGNGQVVGGSGNATFTARLNTGTAAPTTDAPPPFSFAAYEAGEDNEFHVVIRSHGPKLPGQVSDQIHEFNGGCTEQVGPPPGEVSSNPVPALPGQCGDVQLYVFS